MTITSTSRIAALRPGVRVNFAGMVFYILYKLYFSENGSKSSNQN